MYLGGSAFETRSYFTYSSDRAGNKPPVSTSERWSSTPILRSTRARLSRANADQNLGLGAETTPPGAMTAKSALEHAQKLEPNSPETLLALRLLSIPGCCVITGLPKPRWSVLVKCYPAAAHRCNMPSP